VIISRRTGLMVGSAAHVDEKRNTFRVLAGNLKQGGHLHDLDVYGRVCKWMLKIRG
jgi:hypothetical protein